MNDFCPFCGKPVPPNGRFCGHCGKEILANLPARQANTPAADSPVDALLMQLLRRGLQVMAGLVVLVALVIFGMRLRDSSPGGLAFLPPRAAPAQTETSPTAARAAVLPPTAAATEAVQPSSPTPKPSPTATRTAVPTPAARFSNFYACAEPCSGSPSAAARAFAEKSKYIYVNYDYENIPPGAHYTRTWSVKGRGEWVRYDCTWPGPSGGHESDLRLWDMEGLTSGEWTVTITIDGEVVLQETLTIRGDWDIWTPAGVFDGCYGRR